MIEKVKTRAEELNGEVWQTMINKEKNSYDADMQLPNIEKYAGHIQVTGNSEARAERDDTRKNKKRREKRLNKLGEYIQTEDEEKAKETILSTYYYTSMSEIGEKCEKICNKQTTKKIINSLFEIVGLKNEPVPKAVVPEIAETVKKWTEKSKIAYKAAKNSDELWKTSNTKEIIFDIFEVYLLAKKIILINCKNLNEYEQKIKKLNKNENLQMMYAAAKAVK